MTENLTFSDKIHEFYCSCSSGISATGDFSLVDPRPGSFDGCIRNVSANWIQEAGAFVLSFRIPLENYYDRCKSFFVESPFVKTCRRAIRKVRTFAKTDSAVSRKTHSPAGMSCVQISAISICDLPFTF